MTNQFALINRINHLKSFQSFHELIDKLTDEKSKLYISSIPDSVKSIFVTSLVEKENSILILLPDNKSFYETNVELTILGFGKHVIAIDKFDEETIQEKLTEIN